MLHLSQVMNLAFELFYQLPVTSHFFIYSSSGFHLSLFWFIDRLRFSVGFFCWVRLLWFSPAICCTAMGMAWTGLSAFLLIPDHLQLEEMCLKYSWWEALFFWISGWRVWLADGVVWTRLISFLWCLLPRIIIFLPFFPLFLAYFHCLYSTFTEMDWLWTF